MNKNKKRRIVGVAIISGVILVSVATVGVTKLVNEKNAINVTSYATSNPINYNASQLEVTRKIKFNKNGGTGGTNYIIVTVDAKDTKKKKDSAGVEHRYCHILGVDWDENSQFYGKINIPQKLGYAFKGYFKNGTMKVIDEDGAVYGDRLYYTNGIFNSDNYMLKGSNKNEVDTTTYVAKWEPLPKMTLDKQGGTGGTSEIYIENGKVKDTSDNITFEGYIKVPKKDGYIFKGYYLADQKTKCIEESGLVTKVVQNQTLYAKWIKSTYEIYVMFDKRGGTGGSDGLKEILDLTDYKYSDDGGVMFKDKDWSIIVSNELQSFNGYIDTPKRDCYKFLGYIGKKNGEKLINESGQLVWGGYDWSSDLSGYTKFDAFPNEESETYTYVAKWKQVEDIPVTLDKQGGTGGVSKFTKNTTGGIKADNAQIGGPVSVPTKSGVKFGGYYTGKNGTGTQKVSATGNCLFTNISDKDTWYAYWIGQDIPVTLDKQGGVGGNSQIVRNTTAGIQIDGQSIAGVTFNAPTKTNYKFGGYYTGKNGTGTRRIGENGEYLFGPNDISKASSWYAYWIPYTHTVHFDGNGGFGVPLDQTKTTGKQLTIPELVPSKNGYTFKCWKGTDGNEYLPNQQYTTDVDGGTVTLVAQYSRINETWDISENSDGSINATLSEDGTLTITGTGKMKDFDGFDTPWYKMKSSITKVNVSGISYLGNNAFKDCENLKVIIADENLTDMGKAVFSDCTSLDGVEVPNLTYISDFSFRGCTSLPYIDLTDNFTKIGDGAFTNCTGLKTAKISKNVKSIGNAAFQNCTALEQIELREGLTTIDDYAFGYCTSLKSIYIPSSVNQIGSYIFDHDSADIVISGVAGSTAEEYAKENNITFEAVEVTNIGVESVTLNKTSSTIKVGGTESLVATINPENATNKGVAWKSDNTAVATVNANGVVTGKSEGTATITVTTKDGSKTAECKIRVENEIEDKNGPIFSYVKGEKDSNGNYKIVIKATDESGISKVLVNGQEITTKDEDGNYYFVPTKNGEYKIEAYDTSENKTEYTYTEENISEDNKDNDDNNNDNDNNDNNNGNNNNNNDSDNDDDNNGNNGGSSTNNGATSSTNTNNSKNNLTNNGTTSSGTTGKTGNTIGTSTALTNLPKTGTKMGAFFATIASGIVAIFAYFKQKKEK